MSVHADATHRDEHDLRDLRRNSRDGTSGASTFSFIDNRPDAIRTAQLKHNVAMSSRSHQLRVFQTMADGYASRQVVPAAGNPNGNGLPDSLKSGIESLSGLSMDDIKVHYRSDKPAQLQAHAYAQGNEIHLAPGQEQHLPHEAWHVVQQKQGRVAATRQLKGSVSINDDAGLEAEADVMGASAARGAEPDGKEKTKQIATGGVRHFPGVMQRVKITTPPKFKDPQSGITYLFDDILTIDLAGIIAAGVEPDDPNIETFEWMLKGARAEYVLLGKAQEVRDIDEVLQHLANPHASVFTAAAGSHRLGGTATDFGAIKGTVEGLFPSRGDYQIEIGNTLGRYGTRATLDKYTKLREYVEPFTQIADTSLNANSDLRDEVLTLFSWLIPLHDKKITGLLNKESLMYRIKICLLEKTNALKHRAAGTTLTPSGSLIRYGAMQVISGEQLGAKSEIKTALPGALKSGESATARDLETRLTNHFRYPGNAFVAGHLVADSLGGKNVRENLTPITNKFNTSGGSNGIKGPEIEALRRLKAGRVIFYSTTVTYGNAGSDTWQTAVRPTRIQIRLANLGLRPGGVATDIVDYKNISQEFIYDLNPT